MYFDKKDILGLDKIDRINLINSITGIKPVLLVGTRSLENGTNLAIFSSVVHISSNPSRLGFFLRTNKAIRRDTFDNIIENNVFTFNHINLSLIKRAHNTSIKFEKNVSEFDRCKFTEEYIDGFFAPFVKESNIKIGMSLKEIVNMESTESKLIIGEIDYMIFKQDFLDNDFTLNLEKTNSIAVGGLNHYYENKKCMTLPYARLNNMFKI